jgi:hypothetical protein
MESDILALKAILSVILLEMDEDSLESLRTSAAGVIAKYSKHSEQIKQDAVAAVANVLDFGGVKMADPMR